MSYHICWLRRQFNWMGTHSGYDLLCSALWTLPTPNTYHSIWQVPDQPLPKGTARLVKRFYRCANSSPMYALDSSIAELKLLWHNWRKKPNLTHICYVENQLGLIPQWRKYVAGKLIATAHQPAGWWRLAHNYPETIAALDGLIIVGNHQIDYFEQYLPNRVFYIPHGVDTEFFTPQDNKQACSPFRFLYSGKHLRDLDTLAKVIDRVLAEDPRIQFDILLPKSSRDRRNPTFIRLARHPQVHWHANLSDEQLRNLYRNATALLLPLLDCTANNALLEGLACGLPVISNDVGSLRNYTQDSFAHLFPVGEVEGMTQTVLKFVNHPAISLYQGKAAREFVEQNFQWSAIATRTLEVYQKILTQS